MMISKEKLNIYLATEHEFSLKMANAFTFLFFDQIASSLDTYNDINSCNTDEVKILNSGRMGKL